METAPLETLARLAAEQQGVRVFLPLVAANEFATSFLDVAAPLKIFEAALRDGAVVLSSSSWRSPKPGLRSRSIELRRNISGSPRRVVHDFVEWLVAPDTLVIRIFTTTPDWAPANKVASLELMIATPAARSLRSPGVPAAIPAYASRMGELLVLSVFDVEIDRTGAGLLIPAAYARSTAVSSMTADRELWCSLAGPALKRAERSAHHTVPPATQSGARLNESQQLMRSTPPQVAALERLRSRQRRLVVAAQRARTFAPSPVEASRVSAASAPTPSPDEIPGSASDGDSDAGEGEGVLLPLQHGGPQTTGPLRRVRWFTLPTVPPGELPSQAASAAAPYRGGDSIAVGHGRLQGNGVARAMRRVGRGVCGAVQSLMPQGPPLQVHGAVGSAGSVDGGLPLRRSDDPTSQQQASAASAFSALPPITARQLVCELSEADENAGPPPQRLAPAPAASAALPPPPPPALLPSSSRVRALPVASVQRLKIEAARALKGLQGRPFAAGGRSDAGGGGVPPRALGIGPGSGQPASARPPPSPPRPSPEPAATVFTETLGVASLVRSLWAAGGGGWHDASAREGGGGGTARRRVCMVL